jgi:hypothetical protein
MARPNVVRHEKILSLLRHELHVPYQITVLKGEAPGPHVEPMAYLAFYLDAVDQRLLYHGLTANPPAETEVMRIVQSCPEEIDQPGLAVLTRDDDALLVRLEQAALEMVRQRVAWDSDMPAAMAVLHRVPGEVTYGVVLWTPYATDNNLLYGLLRRYVEGVIG